LNKSDFVIRAIRVNYDEAYPLPRGGEVLSVDAADYLYCAGALQIPNEQQGSEKEAAYRESAENERTLFFDAPELASYLTRVKP
jgi:hypothetical protein